MANVAERMVEIGKIVCTIELRMRVELDKPTIAKYRAEISEGSVFPPVEATDVNGELLLTNGFHRLAARRANGETEVLVRIHTGSYEDAQDAAARADAHGGLVRSNADKRRVVDMLIRMERHMDDSDRVIASIAGIADHHLVAKLRRKLKNNESSGIASQLERESALSKPKKRKGLDGKRRRVKDTPPKAKPPKVLPIAGQLATKYTPEQIGWPAPSIADLPDPEHPGYTHAQWFIFQNGHVHLTPVKERAQSKQRMALVEFTGAVRKFGEAAKAFAAVPSFTPEQYFEVAATMDNGAKLWINKLAQHIDVLLTGLRVLEPFAPVLKERALRDATSEVVAVAPAAPAEVSEQAVV